MSSMPLGDGGVAGTGSEGLGGLTGMPDASQQASLGGQPVAAGPVAQRIMHLGASGELVWIYLGGAYNRVSFEAVSLDAAGWPATAVLELVYSTDGNLWSPPSTPAELSAAGTSAANTSTGRLYAGVRVKTPVTGLARVTISAANTAA